jgi:hypothetical protein
LIPAAVAWLINSQAGTNVSARAPLATTSEAKTHNVSRIVKPPAKDY